MNDDRYRSMKDNRDMWRSMAAEYEQRCHELLGILKRIRDEIQTTSDTPGIDFTPDEDPRLWYGHPLGNMLDIINTELKRWK